MKLPSFSFELNERVEVLQDIFHSISTYEIIKHLNYRVLVSTYSFDNYLCFSFEWDESILALDHIVSNRIESRRNLLLILIT